MTPEREAYLAKCSKREVILRHWIKVGKGNIARYKFGLNYDKTFTDDDIEYCLGSIRFHKDRINCYRHELARLQGMDRVVVPRQVRMATYPASHGFGFGYECVAIGLCACGAPLRDDESKYCQKCGKRVLWEKVK